MYTFLFVPPGVLFLLSLWGFLYNFRGFIFELRKTLFPARRLFFCVLFVVLGSAGFMGMVWVMNLMITRNAHPVPVDPPPPCC